MIPGRSPRWSSLGGLLGLVVAIEATAQPAPLPLLLGGGHLGVGMAYVPTGGADTVFQTSPQGTLRLDVGVRIARSLGLGLEFARAVTTAPERCDLIDPSCEPGVAYSALAASASFAPWAGKAVLQGGAGGYRLAKADRGLPRTTWGMHAGVEFPGVHRMGGGTTAGLRVTVLPDAPGRSVTMLSVYLTLRGWTYAFPSTSVEPPARRLERLERKAEDPNSR
jgi:hypothetical protein